MKKPQSPPNAAKPDELSRQVTRERLKKVGVPTTNTQSNDPDLKALLDAVRQVNSSSPSTISASILRKLGGV